MTGSAVRSSDLLLPVSVPPAVRGPRPRPVPPGASRWRTPETVAADEVAGVLVSTVSDIHGRFASRVFDGGDCVGEWWYGGEVDAREGHGWLVYQLMDGLPACDVWVPDCGRCGDDGEVSVGLAPYDTVTCPRCHGGLL